MAEIKSNYETSLGIIVEVDSKLELFNLGSVTEKACINTEVEENCDETYENGREFIVQLKAHVKNAREYIKQIADTLEEADKKAAKNIFDTGLQNNFNNGNWNIEIK